jgi:hypothetical protein
MADPDPETAPVIPPVIAPIVQSKVPGADADNDIFVADPLQMVVEPDADMVSDGLTMTVIV